MTKSLLSLDRAIASFKHTRKTRRLAWPLAITFLAVLAWNLAAIRRRVWEPAEVPVAFWSWRLETPSDADVGEAIRQTRASTLFLRAGQIDYESGRPGRIRGVTGRIPDRIPIHLVYNSTRSLLSAFERISAAEVCDAVLAASAEDQARVDRDQAKLAGLQLDFDVPTRLLPHYAEVLVCLRARLPRDLQLSITGLPTWLESPSLNKLLSACDFWIPQFYGAEIPERLDQRIPISSPEHVARSVSRTRGLGYPFYAGLAAYSHATHYSKDGSLIGIRGDLDPVLVTANPDFELEHEMAFFVDARRKTAGEWRWVYRALRDVAVDGTSIRAGEALVLDRPTGAGLRACARKVREQAGDRLLGICVFRISGEGDATTLTLPEIASALRDVEPKFSLDARLDSISFESRGEDGRVALLELKNTGATASCAGDDALTVLVRVPAGSVDSLSVDQTASAEPLFDFGAETVPCTIKRANAIKLSTNWWPPGAKLITRIGFRVAPHEELSLGYEALLDDGSTLKGSRTLRLVR